MSTVVLILQKLRRGMYWLAYGWTIAEVNRASNFPLFHTTTVFQNFRIQYIYVQHFYASFQSCTFIIFFHLTWVWTPPPDFFPSPYVPLKLSLSRLLVLIYPNPPTPEVKPYSWIILAAVWPNVHWHICPRSSLSFTPFVSSWALLSLETCCTGRRSALHKRSYWQYFTTWDLIIMRRLES